MALVLALAPLIRSEFTLLFRMGQQSEKLSSATPRALLPASGSVLPPPSRMSFLLSTCLFMLRTLRSSLAAEAQLDPKAHRLALLEPLAMSPASPAFRNPLTLAWNLLMMAEV